MQAIEPLNSPWEIDPIPLPLRMLQISPDVDSAFREPKSLKVKYGRAEYSLPLTPVRFLLIGLKADIQRIDPDLILTDYGDAWLFPHLMNWSQEIGIELNPNRDQKKQVLTLRLEYLSRLPNAFFKIKTK